MGKRTLALATLALFICSPAFADQPNVQQARDIPNCPAPGAAVCRNTNLFSLDEAKARLGATSLAFWIDDTNLNIVAQAEGQELKLTGTLQEGMRPLTDGPGLRLWGASYSLPHLDQSMLSISVRPMAEGATPLSYLGPKAPRPPREAMTLQGRVETLSLDSPALGAARNVSIYTPAGPPPKTGFPVVYMTDGNSLNQYARIVDPMIRQHLMQPVMLVGIWAGQDPTDKTPWGLRGREYIQSLDDAAAFNKHAAFVLEEVVPLMERDHHASTRPDQRLLYGFSNGADWMLWVAATHPKMFRQIAAFSVPGTSPLDFSNAKGVSLHLEAGAYEAPFLRGARRTCVQAKAAGAACEVSEYYAGHASDAWHYEFARLVKDIFGTKPK